ncbi:restriction endonuclease subunit S [Thalassoglobus sp.]|uniref:restriction endonuclease subunit S n=1 Tax=Thalassoglobus sp. TaxID=2795869 RepID=UPI003AA7E115
MQSEWTPYCVGDLFDLVPGFAFKSREFVASGVPVLKIKNVKANQLLFDDVSYVDPAYLNTKPQFVVRDGDLLISMTGNRHDGTPSTWVGKIAQYRGTQPYLVNQRVGILRPKNGVELNRRFCSYLLSSSTYQDLFIAIATSSGGQANLSPAQIYGADLSLPPLRIQDRIAEILGTLDDKIELNRLMNETLEAMARRLFKSWFVDFDPVHAKATLRRQHPKLSNADLSRRALPNMAPEIAELFPDEFEDSTIGPIPKGWTDGAVADAIDINPRRTIKKGETIKWLDMKNMPTTSARATDWEEREFKSGTKFEKGDTLVARITPCLENGKTAFVDFLDDDETAAGSTEYIVLRPRAPLPPVFAYFLARNEDFRQHLIANMTGTSGRQRVPADCINGYPLAIPDEPIASQFGQVVEEMFAQMKKNDEESADLARTRDRLLPRLLSGELTIPDGARP